MYTYRVYVETPSSNDVERHFSGDDEFALELSTTTSFYQSPFGSEPWAEAVSPAMMTVAPDAAYRFVRHARRHDQRRCGWRHCLCDRRLV